MSRMMLEDAIILACRAHRGQVDLAGAPYILHPLRVMARMHTEIERMVAMLHDVVEDTNVTPKELEQRGYPPEVVSAVEVLSHRLDEPYDKYVERVAGCDLARRVKLADLEDNMQLDRLQQLRPNDRVRLSKYQKAWLRLTER